MSLDPEKFNKVEHQVTEIRVKVDHIGESVDGLKQNVESKYVTKDEFMPVKLVTYGLIGILSTSVIASIVALALK